MRWSLYSVLGLAIGVQAFSGRATFYETGLGSCGGWNSNSDYIVALNVAQYGGGCTGTANCGRKLRINFGGNSAVATVTDCCPSCSYGSLDMAPGLFNHFASPAAGVFYMTWNWVDGEEETTTTTSKWIQPTTTTTWKPTTTTTKTTQQWTSTTQQWTSTTQQQQTTWSQTTTSSSHAASASAQVSNTNNATANNLVDVNMMVLQMANMIGAAAQP